MFNSLWVGGGEGRASLGRRGHGTGMQGQDTLAARAVAWALSVSWVHMSLPDVLVCLKVFRKPAGLLLYIHAGISCSYRTHAAGAAAKLLPSQASNAGPFEQAFAWSLIRTNGAHMSHT